jgi:hypothetical protein
LTSRVVLRRRIKSMGERIRRGGYCYGVSR